MPTIVYRGPFDGVEIPRYRLAGIVPGVPMDVPDDVATDLLAQVDNWSPVIEETED